MLVEWGIVWWYETNGSQNTMVDKSGKGYSTVGYKYDAIKGHNNVNGI